MDQLQLPHAKLLYFVSELWKAQQISDSEKTIIKEMIINDEPVIFEILEQYETSSDEAVLKDNIISLVRPTERILNPDGSTVKGTEQDDLSSPLGNRLLERKKRHKKESRELEGLANALKPTSN